MLPANGSPWRDTTPPTVPDRCGGWCNARSATSSPGCCWPVTSAMAAPWWWTGPWTVTVWCCGPGEVSLHRTTAGPSLFGEGPVCVGVPDQCRGAGSVVDQVLLQGPGSGTGKADVLAGALLPGFLGGRGGPAGHRPGGLLCGDDRRAGGTGLIGPGLPAGEVAVQFVHADRLGGVRLRTRHQLHLGHRLSWWEELDAVAQGHVAGPDGSRGLNIAGLGALQPAAHGAVAHQHDPHQDPHDQEECAESDPGVRQSGAAALLGAYPALTDQAQYQADDAKW